MGTVSNTTFRLPEGQTLCLGRYFWDGRRCSIQRMMEKQVPPTLLLGQGQPLPVPLLPWHPIKPHIKRTPQGADKIISNGPPAICTRTHTQGSVCIPFTLSQATLILGVARSRAVPRVLGQGSAEHRASSPGCVCESAATRTVGDRVPATAPRTAARGVGGMRGDEGRGLREVASGGLSLLHVLRRLVSAGMEGTVHGRPKGIKLVGGRGDKT